MTNEEARKFLTYEEHFDASYASDRNAIELAIIALNFRIPERPHDIRKYDDEGLCLGKCPICEAGINSEMKFCMECGQAIKWRDDE